jgi:hypothetical protein
MAAAAAAILDYLYSSCTGKQNINPTTNNYVIIDRLGSRGWGVGGNEGKWNDKGDTYMYEAWWGTVHGIRPMY